MMYGTKDILMRVMLFLLACGIVCTHGLIYLPRTIAVEFITVIITKLFKLTHDKIHHTKSQESLDQHKFKTYPKN